MKRIIATIMASILSLSFLGSPVMATSQPAVFASTNTVVLGGCGSESGEAAIRCVLDLVVNIMSIGVGIFGVIGISVVGVQYLTAGGSEEKARKAKRRMFEIVIGLAVYAVIYFIIQWLVKR